jgi:hypothetical protein
MKTPDEIIMESNTVQPIETTISASFTGKISTAQWENSSPFFSFSEKYSVALTDEQKEKRQKELSDICTKQFETVAERLYQAKIAKLYENIRFYKGINGILYPSVTSIIGMDDSFGISPEELAQYGARGSIFHKQIEVFLLGGTWKEPKNIPETFPDLLTMVNGSLELNLNGYSFVNFFADYPFKCISVEDELLNAEFRYGGRRDCKGIIESSNKGKWAKIENIIYDAPSSFDWKTGQIDKIKVMKQGCAYAKCDPTIVQHIVVPFTAETQQGYSKPIVESDMEKYWTLFTSDRAKFKKRYGV